MEKTSRFVVRAIATISLTALCGMALLITADVIGRKLGNPVPGAFELTELALILTVCLSLAYTALQGAHVSVELLVSRLGRAGRLFVFVVTGPLALAGIAMVIWGGMSQALNDWHVGLLRSAQLGIPLAAFKFVVPLGFLLLAVVVVVQWIHAWLELLKFLGVSRRSDK
jgi:TRAP-type C4-dicarboxylate transport system permease small subunit